jgi:hypothetical protein
MCVNELQGAGISCGNYISSLEMCIHHIQIMIFVRTSKANVGEECEPCIVGGGEMINPLRSFRAGVVAIVVCAS